jgi:hypothetical protein
MISPAGIDTVDPIVSGTRKWRHPSGSVTSITVSPNALARARTPST